VVVTVVFSADLTIGRWKRNGRVLRAERMVLEVLSADLAVAGGPRVMRERVVEEPTVLVVLSAGLEVAGWKRVQREGTVDEVTVGVRSAVMVVFSAGLTNADWKRVARELELRVMEANVLVAVGSFQVVKVGSSGNVSRLSWRKSVTQASSILLASEDGMG